MLYYIMLYYIMLYYVMLYYVMLYYIVILYYIMLYYIMLCYIILCYVILYYVILYYIILWDHRCRPKRRYAAHTCICRFQIATTSTFPDVSLPADNNQPKTSQGNHPSLHPGPAIMPIRHAGICSNRRYRVRTMETSRCASTINC